MEEKHKITVVPLDIWNEPQPPMEFGVKLITLNKSDLNFPKEPTKHEPDVIDGFDFWREDDQYNYDGVCRVCSERCSHTITRESSWVHEYMCPACLSLAVVSEGDKMGGQFDHIWTYTQVK